VPESLSRTRGVVGEITFIAPIRRGPVPDDETPNGTSPRRPIRFADRLRMVLEAFNDREDQYDGVTAKRVPMALRAFGGIHFAHMALIDGETRFLFSVDFDGSPRDYLAGLANNVPWLLHLVFSNCEGWKSVENDPWQLIRFIEAHQVKTHFWYAHMPELTARDLEWFNALNQELDSAALDGGSKAELISQLRALVSTRTAPLSLTLRIDQMFEEQERVTRRDTYPGIRSIAKTQFAHAFEPFYPEAIVQRALRESLGSAGGQP
jgi:hypothetical protein